VTAAVADAAGGGPPGVFTVPPGASLLDAVAAELLNRWGGEPMALGRVLVLLPTRRAVRALGEALLTHSDGRPLVLPAIRALGDLDPEEETDGETGGWDPAPDLPPPIPALRRQLLLARLVGERRDLDLAPEQAVGLAAELARLLDHVHTQGLEFADLRGLAPPDLAAHWERIVEFLTIVTAAWPAILAEEGAMDPAARRNAALAARAEAWRRAPPDHPVIAAGSTGSIPATARLLAVIAGLPQGAVVLPGLDRHLDDESWAALDDTHPQVAMRALLREIGIDRGDVRDWPLPQHGEAGPAAPSSPGRLALVSEVMRPAAGTAAWRDLAGPDGSPAATLDDTAIAGLQRLDCPTPHEEAGAIALMMRAALDTPGRTAALVTPDRGLARRVGAALGRWGLRVDDTAGRPLGETPVGAFLRLAARCARDDAAPVGLLALLKHPLAAGSEPPAAFRHGVREVERGLLRGPRPAPGFAGLRGALDAAFADPRRDRDVLKTVKVRLRRLEDLAAPFFAALTRGETALTDLVAAHIAFAEALARAPDQAGSDRLWRGEDGEAAAAFVDELLAAAEGIYAVDGRHYPALVEALMAGRVVRPAWGGHPRLAIRGPLEARLQRPDLLILGGLNEGTWPGEPAPDPWMSRPMRRAFGLLSPERRIGLAAHDFAQGLAAPEVVLTRAERAEGTPTVPARWLLRLDAVLAGAGLVLPDSRHWRAWGRALDAPERVQAVAPPAPQPPLAARPRRLSVTEIGTWMRDPYAIYARHVLGLEALEPLDADPTAADRGQAVHAALHLFMREDAAVDGPAALERLLAQGRAAFAALMRHPAAAAFWWPRFARIAAWVLARECERRPAARPVAVEVKGSLGLAAAGGPFTLTARADRIDRLADGRLAIIDYKTGIVPGKGEIEKGYEPQLPLEAAIAAAGGFEEVPPSEIAELAFWRLSGGEPAGEIVEIRADKVAVLMAAATAGLEALIARFDDPATPYLARPRAAAAPRFSDTAHLARVAEWSVAEAGEEEA
jgi:ATP-dependent helicase/nuclease subunit B